MSVVLLQPVTPVRLSSRQTAIVPRHHFFHLDAFPQLIGLNSNPDDNNHHRFHPEWTPPYQPGERGEPELPACSTTKSV